MSENSLDAERTGLYVTDIYRDESFMARPMHPHNLSTQMEGLRRLFEAFLNTPSNIMQELVNAAIDLCGAESAGISIEQKNKGDDAYWHWTAVAGRYAPFRNSSLPRYPSACGVCLDRGTPQVLRVKERFFEIMGIQAANVTDGILLPWVTPGVRGTIWIVSHSQCEAFNMNDLHTMQTLAEYAALATRRRLDQVSLMNQTAVAAVAAVLRDLAQYTNSPLWGPIEAMHPGATTEAEDESLEKTIADHLQRLSASLKLGPGNPKVRPN